MDTKNNEGMNNNKNIENPKAIESKQQKMPAPKKAKATKKSTATKSKNLAGIQKSNTIAYVKTPEIADEMENEFTYEREAIIEGEEFVNKKYQLKDIINKTKTTVNYNKALSQTIVKPVIVQEVTTLKPIIAPVSFQTPVNFFKGKPLGEEDLIIQNFFKNTTPYISESGQNKDNTNANIYSNDFNSPLTQTFNYYSPSQVNTNQNILSQSVKFQRKGQNIINTDNTKVQNKKVVNKDNINKNINSKKKGTVKNKITKNATKVNKNGIKNATNILQSKTIVKNVENTNKSLRKSLRQTEKFKNITVNNMLKSIYPNMILQKSLQENTKNEVNKKKEEKVPRDSIRIKK